MPAENLRIEDYVLDFIPECMRRVRKETGEKDVSVVGYCFGGCCRSSTRRCRARADPEPRVLHHAGRFQAAQALPELVERGAISTSIALSTPTATCRRK